MHKVYIPIDRLFQSKMRIEVGVVGIIATSGTNFLVVTFPEQVNLVRHRAGTGSIDW